MTKRQGYFLIGAVWLLIMVQFREGITFRDRFAFFGSAAVVGWCIASGFETKD